MTSSAGTREGPGGLRRLERRAGAAWRTAVVALVVANVVFVFGVSRFLGQDVADLCARRGQPYVPAEASTDGGLFLFPLSQPCNTVYDLVPAWVTPLVVLGMVVVLGAGAYFLVLRRRLTAARGSTDEETS